MLSANLTPQWEVLRKEEGEKTEAKKNGYLQALDEDHVEVHVSEVDRDPYGIMVSRD